MADHAWGIGAEQVGTDGGIAWANNYHVGVNFAGQLVDHIAHASTWDNKENIINTRFVSILVLMDITLLLVQSKTIGITRTQQQ